MLEVSPDEILRRLDALAKNHDVFSRNQERIMRAIEGEENLGHIGLVKQSQRNRRNISILFASMPLAVTAGTALGKMVSDWLIT